MRLPLFLVKIAYENAWWALTGLLAPQHLVVKWSKIAPGREGFPNYLNLLRMGVEWKLTY